MDTNADGEAKTTCYSHLAGRFLIDIKRPNGSNVAHPVPVYFDENIPPTAVPPTGIPVALPAKVTVVLKGPVAVSATSVPETNVSDEKTQEETKKQQEKISSPQTYLDEILSLIRNAFSFFKK